MAKNNSINREKGYRKRFLTKIGDRYLIKRVEEIVAFYTEDKLTYLVTKEQGRQYLVDYSLNDLDGGLLDPTQFYRINRQYVISIEYILELKNYPNRRLKVETSVPLKSELVVSRDRVSLFKEWLNQ